jgi:type II secretory pathway pseudopilin PulG
MQLRPSPSRWARARGERGFTMLLALVVLIITTLLLGGAYVAVLTDTHLSRNDLDQKRAYSAAQAGIEQYNYDLNQNPNFWENCVPPSGTIGAADSGSTESYVDYAVVASTAPTGATTCSTSNPIGTMVEANTLANGSANPAAGTFRLASTGTSNGVSRTIVAQYKRDSFLNFVYYTDYETLDPAALPGTPGDCNRHYTDSPGRGSDCGGAINFISADHINGPLHSEDTLAICGTPSFGRNANDSIEAPGFADESNCGGSAPYYGATLNGTYSSIATSLTPPPTDGQMLNVAQTAGTVYTGTTTIVLTGTTATVYNANLSGGSASLNIANTNGVIYVQSAQAPVCGEIYTPFSANSTYGANLGCGNVYVSGYYNTSITIASDNDIIIDGNLWPGSSGSNYATSTGALGGTPTGNSLLGLVANNFVRLQHPVSANRGTTSGSCGSNANVTSGTYQTLNNPFIYAAILSVKHSFIVDNYDCGSSPGTLTVIGAIAQYYRGPVGTGSSSVSTGYSKTYTYDDRLAYAEPPYFLNPVSVAWQVQHQTECSASVAACNIP